MATVQIIPLSPCSIPENSIHKRNEVREKSDQQENYTEQYDYKTLCYDVFQKGSRIIFSGPPLYGLEDFISKGNIYINDNKISLSSIESTLLNRIQINYININNNHKLTKLKWFYENLEFTIPIQENLCSLFKDKRVLFSKSKNNRLEWITDWINYYIVNHSIDSVLLYDNNSTEYTINDLAEYLKSTISYDINIILIPWNFPYGPSGGFQKTLNKQVPWDSDFCQYGIMEHAKERFLSDAYGILNVDIDELLITPNQTNIFEYLKKCNGISFNGKWIENIPNFEHADVRFYNYFYYDKNNYKAAKKWCISPKKIANNHQWKIHNISDIDLKEYSNVFHTHFRAINLSWKYDRSQKTIFNPHQHRICSKLIQNLNKIYPEQYITAEKRPKLSIIERIIKKIKN